MSGPEPPPSLPPSLLLQLPSDLLTAILSRHGLSAADLSRCEAVSRSLRAPLEALSPPERAAHAKCRRALRRLYGVEEEATEKRLKWKCGGSWKLTLRHLEALEFHSRHGELHVAAGSSFSLAATRDGRLRSFGAAQGGVLGQEPPEVEPFIYTPRVISSLAEHKVVQISAGSSHSLAVTAEGRVFAFGRDEYGCCGTGSFEWQTLQNPTEIKSLSKTHIVQSAAGRRFSVLLALNGDLFTCGEGGVLGHASPSPELKPRLVEALANEGLTAVQVVATADYVLVLVLDRGRPKVFSFGKGWSGALGHGIRKDERIPREIVKLSENGRSIVHVAAGFAHALALDKEGHVWAWGHGCGGCLGNGSQTGQLLPERMSTLPRVIQPVARLAAGLHCSFLIGREGDLYSLGWGGSRVLGTYEGGRLGVPSRVGAWEVSNFEATRVKSLQGTEVVSVSCSPFAHGTSKSHHMLVAAKGGEVYSFGLGLYGQLGRRVESTIWYPNGLNLGDFSSPPMTG